MEPIICYTTKRTYCTPTVKKNQQPLGKWILLIYILLMILLLLLSLTAKGQAAVPKSA